MKAHLRENIPHKQHKALKTISVATAVALAVPAFSMSGSVVSAATTEGTATKSESVYINVDSNGNVKQETVSDWLHDTTKGAVVVDESSLSNITNVTGKEKPKISGNTVVWDLSGNDLYYQGETSKQVPVSMTLSYYLDGQAISPSKLAGKSGKFELKISFQNHDGHTISAADTSQTVYTPFACIAALNLPLKYFTNVTTNFGTITSDGTNQAVSFIGFPGVKESFSMLDLSSLDLPEELDVTADVKDFTLGPIMMAATPVPDLDKIKDTSDLSDLADKLNQLVSAGLELKTATGTLNSGEQAFASGVEQLFEGVSTAGSSFDEIVDGADKLNSSTSNATSGLPALISGTQSVNSGADQLSSGLNSLNSQLPTLASQIASLYEGTKTVDSGVNDLITSLSSGGEIYSSLDQLNSGAQTLSSGASDYGTLADGVLYAMAAQNLNAIQETITEAVASGLPAASAQTVYAESVSDELSGISAQIKSYLAASDENDAIGAINLYDALSVMRGIASSSAAESTWQSTFITDMSNPENTAFYPTTGLSAGEAAIVTYANQNNLVISGSSVVSGAQNLSAGLSELFAGVQAKGQNLTALKSGMDQVTSGVGTLNSTVPTLTSGISQLASGAKALASGTSQLAASSSSLTALQNGIQSLTSGLGLFRTGFATIQSGTSTLNTSAKTLASGTETLNTGMNEFWNQGLSKLQSVDTNKISQAEAVKNEMVTLAKQYTNFTGTGDGISSNVKFIVKTDEIKPSKTAAVKTAKKTTKTETVWKKIGDWFNGLFSSES